MNEIIPMRLDRKQIERLLKILQYWGVSNGTEVVRVALNRLENVIQGENIVNLIEAVQSIKKVNSEILKIKKDIQGLKRNTYLSNL